VKFAALLLAGVGLLFAQEREGNFNIRFEPTATLQTGAPIPFQITVTDANHKALTDAKVKMQIDTNHTHLKEFSAPALDQRTDPGVYVAKPVFDVPGEWNVYVQVRRENGRDVEMTARTIQFTVPQ
jgi:YtkA-like